MKLRNLFVAITLTLAAIAIAAPAQAQIKCKAKQDKRTGVIQYSFVNKGGGTVVYSYSNKFKLRVAESSGFWVCGLGRGEGFSEGWPSSPSREFATETS